jgi:hypothetical protein
MARGGKRPGAGRKGGSKNARREAADRLTAMGLTPLEVLLGMMRKEVPFDPAIAKLAEMAAPYCHPKLASVAHKGDDDSPIKLEIAWASSE